MGRSNKYIVSLIWSLPVLALLFLLITIILGPSTPHVFLLFKTFLLCLGFVSVTSYTYRLFYSVGVSVFASILLIIILGLIPVVGPLVYWGLVLSLAWIELRRLYANLSKKEISIIGIVALALMAVLLPYFSLQFSQPSNAAKLVNDEVHIDTLYHTAIASMMKTYHVVSHGLHGLGALEYHFGSHLFLAEVSNLGFMSAFQSYSYFYVFLCIPLLGVMIIAVAEELLPSKIDIDFYKKLGIYTFIFLGTGVLNAGSLLSRFDIWTSFFDSESYEISLILILSLISVLLTKNISVKVFILLVCGIFGLMAMTKISTGFCALALLGAWALLSSEKNGSGNWFIRWGIVFLSSLIFLLIFQYTNSGVAGARIEPMQFVNAYVEFKGPFGLKVTLFAVLQFIFPILALLYYVSNYLVKKTAMIAPAWWTLGMVLSSAIGLLVLFLLYIEGGAGWYFANVSMFIALPILLCIPQAGEFTFKKFYLIYLAAAVILWLFYVYGPEALTGGARSFIAQIKREVPETTLATYVEKLHIIRDDPKTIDALVYIPRTETGYWHSMDCRGTGYLIPAIAQRPALYAWPLTACYSFLCGPRFHSNGLCEKSQESFTDEQLIAETKKLGFSSVEIVTSSGIRSLH